MSIITTFENQCRALTSLAGPDENTSRFLVGTLAPSADNLLYLFEYKDDNNSLAKLSFKFPHGECWHLSTSSKYPNLVSAIVGNKGHLSAALFRLPDELNNSIEDDYGLSDLPIEKIFEPKLNDETNLEQNLVRQTHWHPDDAYQLLTCSEGHLQFWDIEQQKQVQQFSILESAQRSLDLEPASVKLSQITDLRWSSLFNCSVVAVALGSRIYGIDTRIAHSSPASICWLIEDQRCNRVRSIDFNPNSQYYIASGGDDCRANFWDLRQTSSSVVHMQTHTHWIWNIRYNPFHDQLVLSSGSDARVVLMRAQSVASEPYGQITDDIEDEEEELEANVDDDRNDDDHNPERDDEFGSKQIDKTSGGDSNTNNESDDEFARFRVKNSSETNLNLPARQPTTTATKQPLGDDVINIYEEHDDSVYSAEWATDPWIFASLGFESRLVINKVPKAEKFNILF